MTRLLLLGVFGATLVAAKAADCNALLSNLKLPVKMKTHGKPKVARWGEVGKTLTALRESAAGSSCEFTFGQVFATDREGVFFPLIGNVLRTAPEESLVGVGVYSQDGSRLGSFANRVTFEKRGEYSYIDYYFQFLDDQGKLQSSGNRMLVDIASGKPLFMVKWDEIENKVAVSDQ